MKPLLDIRRFSMGGGLCAQQPLSLFIATLVIMSAFLSGCSSKKKTSIAPVVATTPTTTPTTTPKTTTPVTKPVTTALEGEEPAVGDLMITFSTTNDLMTHYPSFKLGLYDIVAYVRTSDNLHKVSLYDLQPVATTDYTSVIPLELSHLKAGSHLYHGMFKAPAGKLESLSVKVIGALSNVTIGSDAPSLIDAFFSSYTPGDARVPARDFPAEVIATVAGDINITDKKLTMVNIAVDMNLTASMEPLRHVDPTRMYALFTPSIDVTEKTGSLDMSIHQVDLVSMTESSMGMGDAEGVVLTMNYTKAEGVKTFVNGDDASFADVAGLYAIDMMGAFSTSADGHAFEMKHASLAALTEANAASIYQGKVSVADDAVTILGTQQMLATDEVSMMGTLPFDGELAGGKASALGVKDGDMATIWSDGTSAKLLSMPMVEAEVTETETETPETVANKLAFDLHATVSYTPADILSIGTSASTDEAMTLTLSESLECSHYVRDVTAGGMASCDSALTAIEFTKSTEGMYTLHETRQGTVEDVVVEVETEESTVTETENEENAEEGEEVAVETETEVEGIREFALEADTVHHFTNAADFVAALEARVKTDKYRLATFTAEGTVDATTFKVGAMAKAVILQPHEILDNDSDGWITGLLEDEVSDPLGSDKGKSIGLYAGLGVAGVLAVGAMAALVKHLYERSKRFSFQQKIGVNIVDSVEGNLSRMNINGTDSTYMFEKSGKPYAVSANDNGGIVDNNGNKVMNFNGEIEGDDTVARKVHATITPNTEPTFFDTSGRKLKLFSVEGDTVVERKLTLSLDNDIEFEESGQKVKLNMNALDESVEIEGKKYLLSPNMEIAKTQKGNAKGLRDMFLAMAEDGHFNSEEVKDPKAVVDVGDDENFPDTEKKIKRITGGISFVDSAGTPTSDFKAEFTKRVGDFKNVIKPKIETEYNSQEKKYKMTVNGKRFDIAKVKLTVGNKAQEISADSIKNGAIEIRKNKLFVTIFERGPLKMKLNVGTFEGGAFKPGPMFKDVDITGDNGASLKADIGNTLNAEMTRVEGVKNQAVTLRAGQTASLSTFKLVLSKLGLSSVKTPYMNTAADTQRQTMVERVRKAGASVSSMVSEGWAKLRKKSGSYKIVK